LPASSPPIRTDEEFVELLLRLRIGELAALATMSVSSFYRHFRAVTAMTPIQFQKQMRPHEARAARRSAGGCRRGRLRSWLHSPSQFSHECRRMLSVPPSRDAIALREAAALPPN
jgi:AraC-like DNA-binding protein